MKIDDNFNILNVKFMEQDDQNNELCENIDFY